MQFQVLQLPLWAFSPSLLPLRQVALALDVVVNVVPVPVAAATVTRLTSFPRRVLDYGLSLELALAGPERLGEISLNRLVCREAWSSSNHASCEAV